MPEAICLCVSLRSLEVEDQFTIGRSRASEITMAEETGPSAGDLFGEFDLGGGEFGGKNPVSLQ